MELVYKKAGRIELIRYRDGKRFLKNGVVQSLSPQITNNTATLADGNSAMDMVFSSGKAAQVTVNLNSFQPSLYAALVAGDVTDETGVSIRRIEENTIPSASPFTVTLTRTPVTDTVVVHNEDDSPFVKVASDPAVGQYSVSANVVTFNSVDAGKEVVIAYDVAATNAKRMQLSAEASNDVFRLIVAGEAVLRKDEGTTKLDAITFDRVMPTGDIPWPSRQKEPQGWNFTLQVLKPRPGYKVVDYVVEQ
jgi:hypothetical protein